MKRLVVDSNVLIKWFIPEDYSEYAIKLRNDHLMGRIEVVAPKYALLEFCNALRKYVIRGIKNEEDALRALSLLFEASITLIDIDKKSLINALKYSLTNHVTVYDACYIILARNLDTEVYTANEKLLSKLSNIESRLEHREEYRSWGSNIRIYLLLTICRNVEIYKHENKLSIDINEDSIDCLLVNYDRNKAVLFSIKHDIWKYVLTIEELGKVFRYSEEK